MSTSGATPDEVRVALLASLQAVRDLGRKATVVGEIIMVHHDLVGALSRALEALATAEAALEASERERDRLREALSELHDTIRDYLDQLPLSDETLCITNAGDNLNAAMVHARRELAALAPSTPPDPREDAP